MKVKWFLFILVAIMLGTWLITSILNVHQAKNREGILLSPNQSKSAEVTNSLGSTNVMVNFHENLIVGGSHVASGNFLIDDIKLDWLNDDTLRIRAKKILDFRKKEDQVQLFENVVYIKYEGLE
jgi:hypothetical protein